MISLFGILAYPASHSFSPAMHNAAFQFLHLPFRYGRFEISPENLGSFFENLPENIQGLSVSVPHKETCMEFLDHVDEAAQKIGAVNTIVREGGKLKGYNTDYLGFIESLLEHFDPHQKTVLVLGAGGASRAVVYGLVESGAKKVCVWNRTPEKAKELAKEMGVEWAEDVFSLQDEVDLVVNTTSLGMKGKTEGKSAIDASFWKAHHTAYDIVYTPTNTKFLVDAATAGSLAISGERMLSFQATHQVALFTGKSVPVDILEFGISLSRRTFSDWTPYHYTSEEKKDVLGTIVAHKTSEIFLSFEHEISPQQSKNPHRFLNMLQDSASAPHIIAEIKPASPSKGKLIRETDALEDIAISYSQNGVSCISVLTDYTFFGGLPENVARVRKVCNTPILRKDFIIHESQIAEAAFLGADAVLLMRSVLPASRLQQLLEYAENIGLDALVETHTEEELFSVLDETTAKIVGINARNLHTLEIDPIRFRTLREKAKHHPRFSEIIWVAESGISSKEDIEEYAKEADALLIGSALMKAGDRGAKILELRNAL